MTVESEVVRVGLSEALSFIGAVVASTAVVILWVVNRFQTKSNSNAFKKEVNNQFRQVESGAKDSLESFKDEVDKRFTKNETDIREVTHFMHKIDKNLEYIKGRVEPK